MAKTRPALLPLGVIVFMLLLTSFPLLLTSIPMEASTRGTSSTSEGTPPTEALPAFCPSGSPPPCPRGASGTDNSTYSTGPVTYHGGPVMHNVSNYLIFWLPPGYSFDNQTINPAASSPSDARYEGLIDQYFRDVPGSAFYNILQQYTDSTGSPGWSAYGGSIVDTTPFPGGTGTQANPVTDQDTWDRMQSDINARGWNANNGNNEFFLFLPYDVYFEGYNDTCSFHSWFWVGSTNYTYTLMPDAGNSYFGNGYCLNSSIETYSGIAGPSPNGDMFADSEVNNMVHEQFESVSDPIWTNDNTWGGWWYQDGDHEIADECQWQFGPRDSSGGDVILNGHDYLIQPMWSNSAGGCYLPPLTVSDTTVSTSSSSSSVSSAVTTTHPTTLSQQQSTAQTSHQTASSSTSSGGGSAIEEFPYQFLVAVSFTFAVAASYVVARRMAPSKAPLPDSSG